MWQWITDACVLVEQKKKKKGAKSSSQQSSDAPGGSSELESTVTTSASPPISASLLQYASVRVAALVAVQTLLLLTQVALSALFLLSWEITRCVDNGRCTCHSSGCH